MSREDKVLTVVVHDRRGCGRYSNDETKYETTMPVDEFYKLMGVEGSDGFYERIAPGINQKLNQKLTQLGSGLERRISNLESRVKALSELEFKAHIAKTVLRQTINDAETAKKDMEETIERYEATRRAPGSEAHSISPDGETWVCDKCGTIMGRMSLYGKDGSGWRKIPRFCPGCGAKNVDNKDEDNGYAKAGRRL